MCGPWSICQIFIEFWGRLHSHCSDFRCKTWGSLTQDGWLKQLLPQTATKQSIVRLFFSLKEGTVKKELPTYLTWCLMYMQFSSWKGILHPALCCPAVDRHHRDHRDTNNPATGKARSPMTSRNLISKDFWQLSQRKQLGRFALPK